MPGNPARGMLGDYLRAVQLKQQHEQFQQQHDLAQKQLDELHTYHQAEIDRMQAELDHSHASTAQTLRQHMVEAISKGIEQPPENSQPTGVSVQQGIDQNSNLPSDLNSVLPQAQGISSTGSKTTLSPEDLSGFAKYLSPQERTLNVASPEQLARQAASAEGQKKAAEVAAEEPTRASQREIAQTRASATEQAATTRAQSARDVAESKNAALIDRMNHLDQTRKYVADHNLGNNIDEGELSDYVGQVANGNADLKDIPAKFRVHAQTVLNNQNKVALGKAKGDQLNALNDFDGLIDDMNTAANRLPDSGNTALNAVEQVGNKLVSKLPWQTDLKNDMAAVKAKAPGIVRAVGGVGSGRVTNTEIQAQLDNLINAGMTKQQALGKIKNFQRDTYTKAYSDIMGSVQNPQQRVSALSAHGGLQRWRGVNISIPPVKNPQTGETVTSTPAIKAMPDGHEYMWNPNQRQYEDIEAYK